MSGLKLNAHLDAEAKAIFDAANAKLKTAEAADKSEGKKDSAEERKVFDAFQAAFADNVKTLRADAEKNEDKAPSEKNKKAFLARFAEAQKAYVNHFKSEGKSSFQQIMQELASKLLAALRFLFFPALISGDYRQNTFSMWNTGGAHTNASAQKLEETNALVENAFEQAAAKPVELEAEEATPTPGAG